MSLIRRNVTRAIYNTTEVTREIDTPDATTLSFVMTTSDALYVGFKKPFASRYFHFATLNTNSRTLTVQYWDGTTWVAVEDVVDQTLGFTANGFLSWQNPGGWKPVAQTPIVDVELYWIKITVSGSLSAGTSLQAVLNLFCDDSLVKAYYPDLISDDRWLPEGYTNFLLQYVAAKDLVVKRLKADGIITDESMVLDVNEVALAAVHAAAHIIMFPIARGEDDRQAAADAERKMNQELNKVKFDFDTNNSGVIETIEQDQGNVFKARG